MNEQESIFVPIEYENYKKNKIALLKARLIDKKTIEKINDLKKVSSEKNQIRKLLERSLSELKKEFAKFEKSIPEVKEKKKRVSIQITQKKDTRFTKIDTELRQIQEKLNSLRNE